MSLVRVHCVACGVWLHDWPRVPDLDDALCERCEAEMLDAGGTVAAAMSVVGLIGLCVGVAAAAVLLVSCAVPIP